MYKISIVNNVNGRTFAAIFETQEEALSWKEKQIEKDSWGKKAYSANLYNDQEPKPGYVSSEECTIYETVYDSETGEVVTDSIKGTKYFYEVEYTITEEDLSLNAEYVKSQVLAKRQEEYSKIDNLLKEALVEKELGSSTKWNQYIVLRTNIKANNPLPEVE